MPNLSKPEYAPPKTGLLSYLPKSWVPYAELIRIHKPAGIYLFYFPYLFGVLFAACIQDARSDSFEVAQCAAVFALGTVVMRSAACSWNDVMDADFDRQVARCCLRPVARRAISPHNALIYTGAQCVLGIGLLLPLPILCTYWAIPNAMLLGLYPFAKRITHYPQVVLGFPVSLGIPMGAAAMGFDVLTSTPRLQLATGCLCASNVLWTVIYDTIYAHQDVEDDAKAGVKSIAVQWHKYGAKGLLSVLAVTQIALLLATGFAAGFSLPYFVGAVGGVGLSLATMIRNGQLRDPSSCWWWFVNGCWFVGGGITVGLALQYMQTLI